MAASAAVCKRASSGLLAGGRLMANFWQTLPRPFFVLAPMSGVTDFPFREMVAQLAKPDLFFTEFVHVNSLLSPKGRQKVSRRLEFSENQRPIVAQLWGVDPESFGQATKLVAEFGFDGVDINLGCSDRDVLASGGGAGLIENQPLAKKIIQAVKKAAGGMPVSIKTRLGFRKVDWDWLDLLLGQDLQALTLHGRTAKKRYDTPADWEKIGELVRKRNKLGLKTVIIGNGDIKSRSEGLEKHAQTKAEGLMVGRGILSNPWIFEKIASKHTQEESAKTLLAHVRKYEEWEGAADYNSLKKFFKMYLSGFRKAARLRQGLMETQNGAEAKKVLKKTGLI
ncbi:tRNA-dihydrouridine synthase [Patescibacteria group bacterium]|nr:tRNA-dihydrouridine synthase [Patescibacteria group bacterium]